MKRLIGRERLRQDAAVSHSDEAFRSLKGGATGHALVAALQASPYREIEIEPKRARLLVRERLI
jgi:hypothetical protein